MRLTREHEETCSEKPLRALKSELAIRPNKFLPFQDALANDNQAVRCLLPICLRQVVKTQDKRRDRHPAISQIVA